MEGWRKEAMDGRREREGGGALRGCLRAGC